MDQAYSTRRIIQPCLTSSKILQISAPDISANFSHRIWSVLKKAFRILKVKPPPGQCQSNKWRNLQYSRIVKIITRDSKGTRRRSPRRRTLACTVHKTNGITARERLPPIWFKTKQSPPLQRPIRVCNTITAFPTWWMLHQTTWILISALLGRGRSPLLMRMKWCSTSSKRKIVQSKIVTWLITRWKSRFSTHICTVPSTSTIWSRRRLSQTMRLGTMSRYLAI